jgi:hypothetical protein
MGIKAEFKTFKKHCIAQKKEKPSLGDFELILSIIVSADVLELSHFSLIIQLMFCHFPLNCPCREIFQFDEHFCVKAFSKVNCSE